MGKEQSFDAYGVGINGNLFKGNLHGDIEKPVQTWMFEIDMEQHPYLRDIKRSGNFLQLKDILVDLTTGRDVEGV